MVMTFKCIDCGKPVKASSGSLDSGTCKECNDKSYGTFNDIPWQEQGVWLAERKLQAEKSIAEAFDEANEEM